MKRILPLVVLLVITTVPTLRAEAPFIDLFASGDFSQWRVGKKGTGWSIEDGVVHLYEKKAGSLMSRKKYKDFELRFDWKVSEGGNSGVIYRAQKGRGFEYQVLDDERHIRGKDPIGSSGALYDLVPPMAGKPYKPAGQWNTARIVANGNHVEHWLNESKVLEAELSGKEWDDRYNNSKYVKYGYEDFGDVESPIVFQDHGSQVWFRNVRIREMPPKEQSEVVDFNFHAMLSPVPLTAKFIDEDYFIWGASMVRDADDKCHLLYSRWPRNLGHNAWVTHSEIAHAVADSPLGPYRFVDVALPVRGEAYWDGLCTHNPTVHEFDGKYYLYYMGNTGDGNATKKLNPIHRNNQRIGVAVAEHPNGPWKRLDQPLIDISEASDSHDALMVSNPSICRRADGTFVLIYKAVGKKAPLPFGGPVVHLAATSQSPVGPFAKQMQPLFTAPGVKFPAEDPYIWSQGDRCWAIVNDHKGTFNKTNTDSLALFTSTDGLNWDVAASPLVTRREVTWADGSVQSFHRLERPQLWFDHGVPAVLFCAAEETDAKTHSFNVHIPLRSQNSK
ncbi:Glycosyl hydrolases family 43 [Planctomycetes bacterium CA13]|uniref:Glycosyl hydrolases family 43 n=1 Tax=Novipirellula herctigrandis TaxID=2527986 RepID=A0A5C5Z0E8_9BACT|nr:Glycosyl hydrolases family 43 [Planctomycetes bacterium CA13]